MLHLFYFYRVMYIDVHSLLPLILVPYCCKLLSAPCLASLALTVGADKTQPRLVWSATETPTSMCWTPVVRSAVPPQACLSPSRQVDLPRSLCSLLCLSSKRMGKHNKGGGKSWVRGGWQQGNRGSGGGGGSGRGKAGRYGGGGGGGGGAGYGISPTPTARAYGLQQQARRGGGGGGGWAGSSKRGGGFAPTSHAAREAFYSQKQGPPRWHQEAGLPPISDSLHQQQRQQQQRSNGGDHNDSRRSNGSSGGGGKHTARDLLSPAFSQNSSRRRIEFHKATKPSTIFSPSGGPTTAIAAARNVVANNSAGDQRPRTNGGEGGREGAAGGVDDLARLAEKKIGLPAPGKVCTIDGRLLRHEVSHSFFACSKGCRVVGLHVVSSTTNMARFVAAPTFLAVESSVLVFSPSPRTLVQ